MKPLVLIALVSLTVSASPILIGPIGLDGYGTLSNPDCSQHGAACLGGLGLVFFASGSNGTDWVSIRGDSVAMTLFNSPHYLQDLNLQRWFLTPAPACAEPTTVPATLTIIAMSISTAYRGSERSLTSEAQSGRFRCSISLTVEIYWHRRKSQTHTSKLTTWSTVRVFRSALRAHPLKDSFPAPVDSWPRLRSSIRQQTYRSPAACYC